MKDELSLHEKKRDLKLRGSERGEKTILMIITGFNMR